MRFALFALSAVALALASTSATALSISPYSATSDDSYVNVVSHEDLSDEMSGHSHAFVEHEAEAEAEAEAETETEQSPSGAIRVNIDDLPSDLAAKAVKLQTQVDAEAAASEGTFPEGRKVQWEVVFDGAAKASEPFSDTFLEMEADLQKDPVSIKSETPKTIHVHVEQPQLKSSAATEVTDSLSKSLAKMQKTSSKILSKMVSVISQLQKNSQGKAQKDASLLAIKTEKNPMRRKREADKKKKKQKKKDIASGKKQPRKRCRSLKGKAHAGLLTESDKKDWVSAAYHPAPAAPAPTPAPAAAAPAAAAPTFISPETR